MKMLFVFACFLMSSEALMAKSLDAAKLLTTQQYCAQGWSRADQFASFYNFNSDGSGISGQEPYWVKFKWQVDTDYLTVIYENRVEKWQIQDVGFTLRFLPTDDNEIELFPCRDGDPRD